MIISCYLTCLIICCWNWVIATEVNKLLVWCFILFCLGVKLYLIFAEAAGARGFKYKCLYLCLPYALRASWFLPCGNWRGNWPGSFPSQGCCRASDHCPLPMRGPQPLSWGKGLFLCWWTRHTDLRLASLSRHPKSSCLVSPRSTQDFSVPHSLCPTLPIFLLPTPAHPSAPAPPHFPGMPSWTWEGWSLCHTPWPFPPECSSWSRLMTWGGSTDTPSPATGKPE